MMVLQLTAWEISESYIGYESKLANMPLIIQVDKKTLYYDTL